MHTQGNKATITKLLKLTLRTQIQTAISHGGDNEGEYDINTDCWERKSNYLSLFLLLFFLLLFLSLLLLLLLFVSFFDEVSSPSMTVSSAV